MGKVPGRVNYVAKARAYAKAVLDGKRPACQWVKLSCERFLGDLAGGEFRMDAEAVDKVCSFAELLPHIKGSRAGKPMELAPWEIFILANVFGFKRADGTRRYRRSYVEVPRGNGKSTLSAAIALYMLLADRESGAECYSVATTRDQARIVWETAREMARRSQAMASAFSLTIGARSLYVVNTASKFEPLSSDSDSLEGLNTHFACIDELHAHKNRTVYDVMETSIGKRAQPLLWVITTAGSNRAGICYELHSFCQRLLRGAAEDDAQFAVIYTIDDGDDWTSEEALKKANPNWGESVQPDIVLGLQAKAMTVASAANNFRTKHLDEWVNADTAWMDMRAWERCADHSAVLEDFEGQECWIGLDLASKTDIAAMAILIPQSSGDGRREYWLFGRYWLPRETVDRGENAHYQGWEMSGRLNVTPGAVIDFDEIREAVLNIASRFRVRAVLFDPFQATQLSTQLAAEGLPMIEVRPTVLNFSEPMKQLEALVLDGRLKHDGCPVMAWMVSNVVCHRDAKDNIYPRKQAPENKIDGVVASIMALAGAMGAEREQQALAEVYVL